MKARNFIRMAILTLPLAAAIGVMRIYGGFETRIADKAIALMVILITFCFCWFQNTALIVKFPKLKDISRIILSFIICICYIILIIYSTGETIFLPKDGTLHPYTMGIAVNVIVLVLCQIVILQERNEQKLQRINQLEVQNIIAEKELLKKQLQPHFLFNALGTLKALISIAPDRAEKYTVNLSEFLRFSITNHSADLITVREELEYLEKFILLQRERFNGSFHIKYEMEEQCLDMLIPVFAIQTLVENAFKHNQFTHHKPLEILIKTEGDTLLIKNNKNSKSIPVNSTGIGLSNLHERLHLLTGYEMIVKDSETSFIVQFKLES